MGIKKEVKNNLKNILVVIFFISIFASLLATTIATQSGNSDEAFLTIWDSTDSLEKYTICTEFCGVKGKSDSNRWTIYFYSNYTNTTEDSINGTGTEVLIRFNQNGSWTDYENMTFNSTLLLWEYATNFTHKGILNFSVNSTSPYGNITLYDSIEITNTGPYIIKTPSKIIDFNGDGTKDILQCTEDVLCIYNFSANVSEDDLNDYLTFNYSSSSNTTLTNFTLNSSTGILTINYTNDVDVGSGDKKIELTVRDSDNRIDVALLEINVTPENDPPKFLNLIDRAVINKSGFERIFVANDEENDTAYTFNVTFESCVHTSLNPPTGPDNCTLFNLTYFNGTATNVSFTPNGQQRGEYEINFTVTDSRNASHSEVVNWTVSWNDAPYFEYVCDNERNATEDSEFNCYINVSDPDEVNNLTFIMNHSWFTFNSTGTNSTTISTGATGNASALINFTAQDQQVGNWSVNLTVIDTGAPNATVEYNSTIFYFYIENVNDTVNLEDIQDITAYTSETYNVLVNATDDDILIPDKSVLNESLTFFTNNSLVTVSNTQQLSGTNITQATLSFEPEDLGTGTHIINVTVQDLGNSSTSTDLFTINVIDNSAPEWNSSIATNLTYTEGEELYLNLSQNVTDTDDINFTLSYLTGLSCSDREIAIDLETGVINLTLTDNDVGFWRIRVTATDGKTPSSQDFNITINNLEEAPSFNGINTYPNMTYSNGQINLTEDNYTRVYFQILDEDLRICSDQTGFYNEEYTLVTNLTGRNQNLLSFPNKQKAGDNRYQFWTDTLAPEKEDVGDYNLTLNITDSGGESVFVELNLTVLETLHGPNITDIENVELSILGENFYTNVNSSDEEDGSDEPNGNLTFRIENLTASGDFLTINSSTGIINFTSNTSLAGKWEFQVIVNDTDGSEASDYFNISIYDYPQILSPISDYNFSLVENVTSILNFTANHSVADELNYTLLIDNIVKNSTTGYGDATEFLWGYAPNFTMETYCSGMVNLTLNVSNSKLSNSTSWLVEINHTDYPLRFLNPIPNRAGGSPLYLQLDNYFEDFDASDSCRNQTIGFFYTLVENSSSGGEITVNVANWTSNGSSPVSTFTAEVSGSANYSLTAIEYNLTNTSQQLKNATSNNFSVALSVTEGTPQQVQTSSGGGSSTRDRLISLKILLPEPVSARQQDSLVIPLGLENDGNVNLEDIYLTATIAKDGTIRNDLVASFSQSYFEELEAGEKEDTTLIVDIDTESTGLFEVTINASVEDPEYEDWGKFYIEIDPDKDVLEKIIFTEEFLLGNPACFELLDLLEEAKGLVESDPEKALEISENALEACNALITQPPRPRISQVLSSNVFIGYTAIASLLAFVAGFIYYTYKKVSLRRKMRRDLGNI